MSLPYDTEEDIKETEDETKETGFWKKLWDWLKKVPAWLFGLVVLVICTVFRYVFGKRGVKQDGLEQSQGISELSGDTAADIADRLGTVAAAIDDSKDRADNIAESVAGIRSIVDKYDQAAEGKQDD